MRDEDRRAKNEKVAAWIVIVCYALMLLALLGGVIADGLKFRDVEPKADTICGTATEPEEYIIADTDSVETQDVLVTVEYGDLTELFEEDVPAEADTEATTENTAAEETTVYTCGIEPTFEEVDDYTGEDEYFRLTAYCPCPSCCGDWYYTQPRDEYGNIEVHTATGEVAVQGYTIATDWSVIPPGTLVEIEDIGTFRVQDTGVTGNSIDIYFDSHEEALNFGMKYARIRIVEE